MALSNAFVTIGVSIVSFFVYILSIGYRKRSMINELRKQGVTVPAGWSWWFGHLLVLNKKLQCLPSDVNVYTALRDLVEEHTDTEVFLMDLWPMFSPTLMISGPELAHQVAIKYDFPKPSHQESSFKPIIGGKSLITDNGEPWKFWKSLLTPGFSPGHMLSLVPSLVDAMETFCGLLEEKAGNGVFSLDDMAMKLAMDVITKTTLDVDLNNQRKEHELSRALNTILNWHSFWDPRILLNPLRIPVQGYNGRVVSSFIHQELHKRFDEMKKERAVTNEDMKHSKKVKSVIALALDKYITTKHEKDKTPFEKIQLDDNFTRIAANQIRLFIFAGNDTTATALVYMYHALSQHPHILAKMRHEHDSIFGKDTDAGQMLRDSPALINQTRFTLAVIKETLRLYPPASSIRDGLPGISLLDRKGNNIPTEGLSATIMHPYIHTSPRLWPHPHDFLPARWLVETGHALYPPPGTFRPFEQGPRSCIGQTLVMNEIRVALVMTVRKFLIQPAYGEWDMARKAREGMVGKVMRGLGMNGEECKEVKGERAYQTSRSGAHPADGYPCRVDFVRK